MLNQEQMPTNIVGRIKESKQLGRLFNESVEHGARMVLISGETGVGKTALLEQLRVNVAARDGYYLVCKSGQLGSPFPYHPLAELLRVLVSDLGNSQVKEVLSRYSPRVLNELALLVPKLGGIISSTHRGYEFSESLPNKLFLENACTIVKDLIKRRPTVLILEDIPYADPTTLEVLQCILHRPDEFSILICGTYDLDDLDLANNKFTPFRNFIRTVNYEQSLTRINLHSFTREETREFICSLLKDRILPNELVETVFRRSEGSPLVIKHLVKKLIDAGNLRRGERGWEFFRPYEVGLPQEILELFLIRLEGIRPDLRSVLSTAAVIGRKFTPQILAQILDVPLVELIPYLEEAIHLNLIEEYHDSVQGYFTFVSSRLQEVLYENLSYQRKLLLHQQVGLLLEQTMDFRSQPDEFAYHFQWGTDKVKAVKYAIFAGQRAISLCAFHSAWRYFNNAKDFFPLLDEQNVFGFRYSVLEGLAESASFLGYYSEARKYLGQLLGSGAPEGNKAFGSVQSKLGDLCFRIGNFPETLEHYYTALQYCENTQKFSITIRIILTYLEMGHFDEAASLANLLLERAQSSGKVHDLSDIYCVLVLLYFYIGDMKQALEHAQLLKSTETNNDFGKIFRGSVLAQLALEVGPISKAKEQLKAVLTPAQKLQDPLNIGQVETFLARAMILEGKIDDGIENLAKVKTLNVFGHSFTLKANVIRQEILAKVANQEPQEELLTELDDLWQDKICSAFGVAVAAQRVEILVRAGRDQITCELALKKAEDLLIRYPTPRNQIYVLRAQGAYHLQFQSSHAGQKMLQSAVEACRLYGLNTEGLIVCLLWPELLADQAKEFREALGINGGVYTINHDERKGLKQQGFIPADVLEVLNFIHTQYDTDISINDLCKIAALSERQLRRLFNQHVGSSIKEYITLYRVQKAKELLLNPTLNINQIGQLVGIADKTQFCRTFKSFVGVTPTDYRKKQLEGVRNSQLAQVNQ